MFFCHCDLDLWIQFYNSLAWGISQEKSFKEKVIEFNNTGAGMLESI